MPRGNTRPFLTPAHCPAPRVQWLTRPPFALQIQSVHSPSMMAMSRMSKLVVATASGVGAGIAAQAASAEDVGSLLESVSSRLSKIEVS